MIGVLSYVANAIAIGTKKTKTETFGRQDSLNGRNFSLYRLQEVPVS